MVSNIKMLICIVVVLACVACVAFVLYSIRKHRHGIVESKKTNSEKALDKFEAHLNVMNVMNATNATNGSNASHSAADMLKLAETYHYGKHGRPVDLRRAAEIYQSIVLGTGNAAASGHASAHAHAHAHAWMGLGKLWKDSEVGFARDPLKAYTAFYNAATIGGMEDGWLEIAELYMYGMHPSLLPDKPAAGRLYQTLINNGSGSATGREIARRKLDEIWEMGYGHDPDAMPVPGRVYVTLPPEPIGGFSSIVHIQVPSTRNVPVALKTLNANRVEVDGLNVMNHRLDMDEEIVAALTADLAHQWLGGVQIQGVHNDSQNVHDSMVQRSVNNRLQEMTSIEIDAVREFKTALKDVSDLSGDDKARVASVMDSLTESIHSRYDMSEQAVFNKIWGRVLAPENSDRKDDMVKVLAQQMASGVEHGHVVCSTGKIVRMMGALDGMDKKYEDVGGDGDGGGGGALKPEWAIKQEIGEKASHIRKSFEERGDGENAQGMRDALRGSCTADYVRVGILKEHELETMIAPYQDAF